MESKNLNIFSVLLFCGLFLGLNTIKISNVLNNQKEDNHNIFSVELTMNQYDEDYNLIKSMVKTDDLILENFRNMTGAIFFGSEPDFEIFVTDSGGTPRDITGGNLPEFDHSEDKMKLGNGTVAVAVTDYQLQNELYSSAVSNHWYNASGTQFNMTYLGTVTVDDSYNITESGLTLGIDLNKEIFICRDVFSAFTVIAGNVVEMRYKFIFNLGV